MAQVGEVPAEGEACQIGFVGYQTVQQTVLKLMMSCPGDNGSLYVDNCPDYYYHPETSAVLAVHSLLETYSTDYYQSDALPGSFPLHQLKGASWCCSAGCSILPLRTVAGNALYVKSYSQKYL